MKPRIYTPKTTQVEGFHFNPNLSDAAEVAQAVSALISWAKDKCDNHPHGGLGIRASFTYTGTYMSNTPDGCGVSFVFSGQAVGLANGDHLIYNKDEGIDRAFTVLPDRDFLRDWDAAELKGKKVSRLIMPSDEWYRENSHLGNVPHETLEAALRGEAMALDVIKLFGWTVVELEDEPEPEQETCNFTWKIKNQTGDPYGCGKPKGHEGDHYDHIAKGLCPQYIWEEVVEVPEYVICLGCAIAVVPVKCYDDGDADCDHKRCPNCGGYIGAWED